MKTSQKKRYKLDSPEKMIKIVMVLAIAWFLCSALYSGITNLLLKTETVGKETQEQVDTVYGLVEPECVVLNSPATGQGACVVMEGQRVRKNEAVFRVTATDGSAMQSTSDQFVYAPIAGIVSYEIDGYEKVESMAQLMALDFADLSNQMAKARKNVKKEEPLAAKAGMPYAKLINNLDNTCIYLACTSNDYTQTFVPDLKIRVRFPELNYSTIGKIVAVEKGNNQKLLVKLYLGAADQDLLCKRLVKVELPYNTERVIDVPKKAVVYRQNKPGVYVVQKGFAYWKEIEIVEEKEATVVTESLPERTEIVITPKLISDGDKVKVKG